MCIPWKVSFLAVLTVICGGTLIAQQSDQSGSLGDISRKLRAKKHSDAPVPGIKPAANVSQQPAPSEEQQVVRVVTEPPEIADLMTTVRLLVWRKDYEGLDKLAAHLRTTKERFPGGGWKLYTFYVGLREMTAGSTATDADWQEHLAFFKNWMTSRPQSITARVGLADAYLSFAWAARGHGMANTVTEQGWQIFAERTQQSAKVLVDAAALTEKCPQWYTTMQDVALAAGSDKDRLHAIFEKAIAFEPDYYYYYQDYAVALLPKWNGEPGETEAFVEESSREIGGKKGALLYFEIASQLCGECGEFSRDGFSWPKLQEGFAALDERYGLTPMKLNRFAYMAVTYGDKAVAAKAFLRIGDNWNGSVWGSRARFDAQRQWAGLPVISQPSPAIYAALPIKQRLMQMQDSAAKAAIEKRWDDAATTLKKAIEISKPLPETEFELRRSYLMLASNEQRQGHVKEAQEYLVTAVSALSEKSGAESLEVATTLDQTASVEQELKDDHRAEADLRRALEIREKRNPSDHQIPVELTLLASLCFRHDRQNESIELLQHAINKLDAVKPDDSMLTWPLELLGKTYESLGKYEDAEQAYLRMLRVDEKYLSTNGVGLSTPLSRLASLYRAMGRQEDAVRIQQRLDMIQSRSSN